MSWQVTKLEELLFIHPSYVSYFVRVCMCVCVCVCVNRYRLVLCKCCMFVSGHTHTQVRMQSSCLGMDTDCSDT